MSNLDLQLQSNLPTTRNIKSWWSLKEGGRLSEVRAWGFIFRLILQNGDLTLSPTLIEIYRNNFKRIVEGKKEIAIYGDCFISRETLREFHLSNIYICWNNFQFPLMSLLSGRLRDG